MFRVGVCERGEVCRNLAQYACRIKRTGHRKEIVEDIQDDIKALLLLFMQRNGVKPESIVVYRDGVSQGEFHEVCAPHPTTGAFSLLIVHNSTACIC